MADVEDAKAILPCSDDDDEDSDDGANSPGFNPLLIPLCCCGCCCLFILVICIAPTITSYGYASCGDKSFEGERIADGTITLILPNKSMTSYKPPWFSLTGQNADVLRTNNTGLDNSILGVWKYFSYWVFSSRWAYIPESWTNSLIVVSPQWAFFTEKYLLQRCDKNGPDYTVVRSSKAWFSYDEVWDVYNGDQLVATTKQKGEYRFFNGVLWTSTVEGPKGEAIAGMKEDWFDYWSGQMEWSTDSTRPEMLPNYVTSFLGAPVSINRNMQQNIWVILVIVIFTNVFNARSSNSNQ